MLAGKFMIRGPRLLRWLARRAPGRRALQALGGEFFSVRAADGARIAGCYIPTRTSQRKRPFFLTHGWMGFKERYAETARFLSERGHPVVLMDLRAHGDSGGKFSTFGLQEAGDIAAVYDEAFARGWFDRPPISMGFSLGAASVALHLARDARPAGAVLLGPFFGLRGGVRFIRRLVAPEKAEEWLLLGCREAVARAGFRMEESALEPSIKTESRPILFVAGSADRDDTLNKQVARLKEAKQQGWSRMVVVPGVGHFRLALEAWPLIWPDVEALLREVDA